MAEHRRLSIARRLPRFQFSIFNMLVLTAVVASCLGLMKVNLPLGVMVSLLTLLTWSTAVAVAHALHRTAFVLTALVAGILYYLIFSIPLSFAGLIFSATSHWPDLLVLGCFCGASLITSLAFSPWQDGERPDFSAWNIAGPSYVVGFSYLVLWNLCSGLGIRDVHPPGFSAETLLYTAIVITLSLHVGAPAGLVFLELLRDVSQTAIDVARAEEDVFEAVQVAVTLENFPVTDADVARLADWDLDTTKHFLAALARSRRVMWTKERGYHRPTTRLTSPTAPRGGGGSR